MTASEWIDAVFVARPNRFIVEARTGDGSRVEAHLADPGRLIELLVPQARLRLRPAEGRARRTRFSVALVQASAPRPVWVSLETQRANALAHELLRGGRLQPDDRSAKLRREVRCGASRFDFLLEQGAARTWVEVKSVTLVEGGLGLFPDAPTARGRRHLDELAERVRAGDGARALFVVQRSDARSVQAHSEIDPGFHDALEQAERAGVRLQAARFHFDRAGRARFLGTVPVHTSARPDSDSPRNSS